jgi:hypothetical protein
MDLGRRGIRSLAVARTNDEGKWQMLGILTFLDPPRPDTKDTIEKAMEYGVDVKMITGGCLGGRAVAHVHSRMVINKVCSQARNWAVRALEGRCMISEWCVPSAVAAVLGQVCFRLGQNNTPADLCPCPPSHNTTFPPTYR